MYTSNRSFFPYYENRSSANRYRVSKIRSSRSVDRGWLWWCVLFVPLSSSSSSFFFLSLFLFPFPFLLLPFPLPLLRSSRSSSYSFFFSFLSSFSSSSWHACFRIALLALFRLFLCAYITTYRHTCTDGGATNIGHGARSCDKMHPLYPTSSPYVLSVGTISYMHNACLS